VKSDQLPLRKVVIYRNGVGYFERGGHVDSDEIAFDVRPNHVGDFLATLAVMEQGGSSVRSASFPLKSAKTEEAARGTPTKPEDVLNPLETVKLGLDGHSHDLAVGYIAEQPIWKPSYRLVVGKKGSTLQGWGIVQNLSGEDWTNVRLTLVAGAPIAFQSTLGTPVTPRRPVVSDTGETISAVPRSDVTLSQAPAPPPPAAPPSAYAGGAASAPRTRRAQKGEAKRESPSESQFDMEQLAQTGLSAPRTESLLATQNVVVGGTRYDLPNPVTVPNDSATMVLFLSRAVPGQTAYVFAPAPGVPDSARFPLHVARFKNDTEGLLERGPIAVFDERAAFLGQAVLEPVSSGAEVSVPFAVERSISVDTKQEQNVQGVRIARIDAGALILMRDTTWTTTYRVHNGKPEEATVLIKHPRQPGTRLKHPPEGTRDAVGEGYALVPVKLRAGEESETLVSERQPTEVPTDWFSAEADVAVRAYLSDSRADAQVASALKQAWELYHAKESGEAERARLAAERGVLANAQSELQLNLKSIERNRNAKDLSQTLAKRLVDLTQKLADIDQRLAQLQLETTEKRLRFLELVRDIHLARPLPEN
jgi:hypothetical protein